jgi:hypothetical protein
MKSLIVIILAGIINSTCPKEISNSNEKPVKVIKKEQTSGSFAEAIKTAKEYQTVESLIKEYVEIGCGEVSKNAADFPQSIGACDGNTTLEICGKVVINKNCLILLISYTCDKDYTTGLYFYDAAKKTLNTTYSPKLKGKEDTSNSTYSYKGKLDSNNGDIIEFITIKNNKTGETKEEVNKYSMDFSGCSFKLKD